MILDRIDAYIDLGGVKRARSDRLRVGRLAHAATVLKSTRTLTIARCPALADKQPCCVVLYEWESVYTVIGQFWRIRKCIGELDAMRN